MTRETIAIDMDEVLADTLKKVIFKFNEESGETVTLEQLQGIKLRDMHPQHVDTLSQLLLDREFFRDLEVFPDAVRVVKRLTEHYDVYIATAAMDVPTSFDAKYEWLLEHFPFLDPQHFIFCGNKGIVGTDYLIDDNPKQLRAFKGKGIMYNAAHNIHEEGFDRVHSWQEVEAYFLNDK
ncbi:5' nucleotidase, NT5C type [Macrococcus equipercicus]|uniref:Putative 5'(3')-deoxyribonucleotidase n=1 Tax=Macrococcus equipercicus TaxID=69967 RepID=A0A9Q9BRJ7_9STAP|nr:5'(3')-deoxyribonucleotidase [Macrococcus equipercicus]KAA1042428.1 5'(3')-deoxyribonucleotidase [Macrococcus equipercicus]UTH14314.1 5'(3')-deoxyribonucleotidase [Macrococcus equipercicus]